MNRLKLEKEYLFQIAGTVSYGKQLGRTVEMPTANILTTEDISAIPLGVYAATVIIDGYAHKGITHIGKRPSVDSESTVTIETYIFDFSEDIYDKEIILTLYEFIRGTADFKSLEALKKQVDSDIEVAKKILSDL